MSTVTIIGAAGAIGSSVLEALSQRRQFDTYRLVDPRTNVLEALRIDLMEAAVAEDVRPAEILVYGPEEAAEDPVSSDLVVYAATVGEKPGQTRSSFAEINGELLGSLRPVIEQSAGDAGMVLLITNPIDVMAEHLCRASPRLGRERILGYSTNDSTRMRVAISNELGIDAHRVRAYALGVHGEQLVPIFSDVRVDGEPVELDPPQKSRVIRSLDTWLEGWRALGSGRSSTLSTGAGAASVVTAMRAGATRPASVSTNGVAYLPADSHIALPAVLRTASAEPSDEIAFSAEERAGLAEAAERVKALADALA